MNQYEIKSPSFLKILASGFLFITVLSVGTWFGFKALKGSNPALSHKNEKKAAPTKTKTFYSSIGNAPKVKNPNYAKNKAFNKN